MKMDVLEEISIDNAALRCEMGILEGELRTSRAECCRFKRSERAAVAQASKLDRRVAELESELSRLRAQPSEPPPPQQPPHVPAVAEAPAAGDSGDWWRRLSQLSALEKQRALQIICAELEREQVPGTGQLLSCSSFSSLS